MLTLYPKIKPYACHELTVDSGFKLYIEESGTQQGIPVLVLHDGPGLGLNKEHRRYFDPEKFRIVLFDQRGSGQSTPHACLEDNTTASLINDIEAVRKHLAIEKCLLFGGGFGATLSLLYAQMHTQQVLGLLIWSVFLGGDDEIDWIFRYGAKRLYPDYWQQFQAAVHAHEDDAMLQCYQTRLHGADEIAKMSAAKGWASWFANIGVYHPNHSIHQTYNDPHIATSMAAIGAHYYNQKFFLEANQILNNLYKIEHLPCIVVQGRYDNLHPMETAWRLKHHWDKAELNIVRDAGHCELEPGMVDSLVRAGKLMSNGHL